MDNIMGTTIVPLPKTDYCTITIDHYASLIRKETKFDYASHLARNGEENSALQILLKEGESIG